jgi:hypothetical protein
LSTGGSELVEVSERFAHSCLRDKHGELRELVDEIHQVGFVAAKPEPAWRCLLPRWRGAVLLGVATASERA